MIKKSLRAYISSSQFVFAVLLHGKMLRLAFLQSVKQKIHRIFIILVVLAGVAGIYHVKQGDEVLFFLRRFVVDIADQRRVIKALRFHPKIFGALCALALGIDNDGVDQLQNVFLRAQIRKGVIVHTLGKVDSVENGNAIFCPLQKLSYLANQTAFRNSFVKIENGDITILQIIFTLEIGGSYIVTHQPFHLVLQCVLALLAEMNADNIGGAAYPHVERSCRNFLVFLCCVWRFFHSIPPKLGSENQEVILTT